MLEGKPHSTFQVNLYHNNGYCCAVSLFENLWQLYTLRRKIKSLYSIVYYSSLFYSILFLFYSVPILSYSILFNYILVYFIVFYYILSYYILSYSFLFNQILFCTDLFSSLLYFTKLSSILLTHVVFNQCCMECVHHHIWIWPVATNRYRNTLRSKTKQGLTRKP